MARYKRIHVKENIKGPDEFVSFWARAYFWADANKRTVLNYALALTGVALLALGFLYRRQAAEASASAALSNILRDAPQPGAEPKPDELAKLGESLADFAKKYSGTKAGREGELYQANFLRDKKNLAEAEKLYLNVMAGGNDLVSQLACLGLASAYQNDGKFAEAAALLDKHRANSFFEDEIDYMYALNFELSNDKAGALKEYKKYLDKHPSSRNAGAAREAVARLS
ncbi:MAG: tetratricopeptide repeat protein [Nitrospinae bacterium]|nr:tetratricopeptide repeat protein [Nitrospinota bacterium]